MEALLVLLEDKFELLQLNLEDLDVVLVAIALLFELIDLRCELPLVLLAIFDLSERTECPTLGILRPLRVHILHHHVVLVADHARCSHVFLDG